MPLFHTIKEGKVAYNAAQTFRRKAYHPYRVTHQRHHRVLQAILIDYHLFQRPRLLLRPRGINRLRRSRNAPWKLKGSQWVALLFHVLTTAAHSPDTFT
jgi:hypothetical protein